MKRGEGGEGRSKYKGVRKRKWGKWVSEIRLPNSRERIWLGSYDTPEKAARAFDAAVMCLRGRKGGAFNFPQNLPDIPVRRSLPPAEVQAVASRFANEAPPAAPPADGGVGAQSGLELPESPEQWTTSGGTAESGGEESLDWSFLDSAGSTWTEHGGADWPGFYDMIDEFPCEFLPTLAAPPGLPDFMEEHGGASFYAQSSFLWDF
ncbi:unnamed protein product [Spirodela intermedia]|uniref:AP2/ERF domain-containing protein n=1 Tax=Spirodela intermedia TaxID=51605 RepID=A0A7I8KBB0_SPIIN|nr:unnamed protein product [Spirodela intermedia]